MDISPSWAPDNLQIVFESHWDILIMNRDGSGEHFLTNGMWPIWVRDSNTIAFLRAGIRMIDANGENERQAVDIRPIEYFDYWTP